MPAAFSLSNKCERVVNRTLRGCFTVTLKKLGRKKNIHRLGGLIVTPSSNPLHFYCQLSLTFPRPQAPLTAVPNQVLIRPQGLLCLSDLLIIRRRPPPPVLLLHITALTNHSPYFKNTFIVVSEFKNTPSIHCLFTALWTGWRPKEERVSGWPLQLHAKTRYVFISLSPCVKFDFTNYRTSYLFHFLSCCITYPRLISGRCRWQLLNVMRREDDHPPPSFSDIWHSTVYSSFTGMGGVFIHFSDDCFMVTQQVGVPRL